MSPFHAPALHIFARSVGSIPLDFCVEVCARSWAGAAEPPGTPAVPLHCPPGLGSGRQDMETNDPLFFSLHGPQHGVISASGVGDTAGAC